MTDETYENTPISLNEVRASRHNNASLWTPRDALVAALRDLDSGKMSPDSLVVLARCTHGEKPGERTYSMEYYFTQSDPDLLVGLLARAQKDIL